MCVKWWRRVSREEELDQSKAPITRLAGDPDDCECAQEPELLTFSRTRPCRAQAAHDPPAYPGGRSRVPAQRSDLNASRSSDEKISGSSHAAKWPPLSTSLK